MRVTVTRAFLVRGERQEPGSVIDLPDEFAREMITLNKVGPVEKVAAPPPGPMTTTTTGGLVAGRKRKGA